MTKGKVRCNHRRCRIWRFFSVLETAGVVLADTRWPICLVDRRACAAPTSIISDFGSATTQTVIDPTYRHEAQQRVLDYLRSHPGVSS